MIALGSWGCLYDFCLELWRPSPGLYYPQGTILEPLGGASRKQRYCHYAGSFGATRSKQFAREFQSSQGRS